VTLKEKFVSLADQLRAAAEKNDYQGGKSIISQMKETVTGFRTETKSLVAGNEAGAKDALNSALEANSDYFDSLVTEAHEARKDRNLQFFDLSAARAQGRLDKAKGKGADVSALQAKLDEIKELRTELVDAMNKGIAACAGEGLGKCTKPEVEAYKTLREEIKNKYKELVELAKTAGQSQRFAVAITKAREIIAKSETALDGFEKRGADVSAEKAGLVEIKGLVDSAETKYKTGDYTGAQQDLKKAQEMFKDLRSNAGSRRNTK
jgi:tetratricopeptide (TPR) repeat protein